MNIQDIISAHKNELTYMLIGAIISIIIFVVIIGWKRLQWVVKELVKMYSADEKSYFSKKRIESGVAFVISQHGAIFWLANKYSTMSTTDYGIWAGIELTIAGWYVSQIQKEKVATSDSKEA